MNHSPSFFGIDDDLYMMMFGHEALDDSDSSRNLANYDITVAFDPDSLSHTFPEQNVETIRDRAPTWFKTGNRLITKQDYEFFIKNND